jgi:hypothetical protein
MHPMFHAAAAFFLALAPVAALAADNPKPPPKPATSPAAAPKSLGGDKAWGAYASGEKKTLVCYLVGHPAKSVPVRRQVGASVTHRPGDNSLNVVSFALGYAAKPGTPAELDIDGKKFSLFTSKEAAWAPDSATDKTITLALAKGKQAILKATPEKGAATVDTYQLAGFGPTLALIDKSCGVKR